MHHASSGLPRTARVGVGGFAAGGRFAKTALGGSLGSSCSLRARYSGTRAAAAHRLHQAPSSAVEPSTSAAAATTVLPHPHFFGSPASSASTTASRSGASSRPASAPQFGDALLEGSRPHLRTVYSHQDWEALRGPDRYFRHLRSLFRSRILLGLVKPLAYVAAVSLAACALGAAVQQAGVQPVLLPALVPALREAFNLTSGALSLMLVFRTNSSYGRWEEGRKLWGQVPIRTRDLARLALTWIDDEQRELRALMLRWAPAFGKALMCHLRKGEDLAQELKGLLLPHEIEGVMKATHRPGFILQVLSHAVRASRAPDHVKLRMHEAVAQLEDCLGGCERLLSTPVPLCYTEHTCRFLMAWITALPFALLPTCGALTVPLSLLISFLLLGIEKIGVSIEEPFSVLALEDITQTAAADVAELACMHGSTHNAAQSPAPPQPSLGRGVHSSFTGMASTIQPFRAFSAGAAALQDGTRQAAKGRRQSKAAPARAGAVRMGHRVVLLNGGSTTLDAEHAVVVTTPHGVALAGNKLIVLGSSGAAAAHSIAAALLS